MLQTLSEFFFAKRATPWKWITMLPAILALAFLSRDFKDLDLSVVLFYIAIIAISIAYLFRPSVILWILLFGTFAFIGAGIALLYRSGWLNDNYLIGIVPAILMLFAWPMKLEPSD